MKFSNALFGFIKILLSLLLLYLAATLWLVGNGWNEEPGHADVCLVLGSKVESNGKPSVRLQARLDRALELYHAGNFQWVIVSGGVGKEGFDEGVVMHDYIAAHGFPPDHILTDSHGDTTFASAQNTLVLARQNHFKSILVVSQYFHLPRARLALQRCGLTPVYTARARLFEWRDVYSALRETVGYVEYSFRKF